MAQVVIASLQFGLTSSKLAKTTDKVHLAKHIEIASKALDTADSLMWKLTLSHPDFDQMMALSERLKFELESLKATQSESLPKS